MQTVKRASKKFDPKQEAFVRELKDRWLEAVVAQPDLLAAERSKYDVRRQVEAFQPTQALGKRHEVEAPPEVPPELKRLAA